MDIEVLILAALTKQEEYTRSVLPFLKQEYFTGKAAKTTFSLINDYITTYNELPSTSELLVELDDQPVDQDTFKGCNDLIDRLKSEAVNVHSTQWLIDNTEQHCKQKAVYNAILESVEIIDGKSKDKTAQAIPSIVEAALAVGFDTRLGHDYFEDAEERYNYYNTPEHRIPFAIDYLNRITKGGTPIKTLNVLLAGCVHPDTPVKIRYRKRKTNQVFSENGSS